MPSFIFRRLIVVALTALVVLTGGFLMNAVTAHAQPFIEPQSREPLAASSRRTGLVLSEVMYHPTPQTNGLELEYVELFNSQPFPEDISGYRLSGQIAFQFPAGTVLAGGAFLVVARNPAEIQNQYGITNVVGPYTNSLPNDSGELRLRNRANAVLLEVIYGTRAPWPKSADGAGHSLVLARPSYGEGDPRAWAASDVRGGSPGRREPVALPPDPLRAIVINELLAHSTDPPLDFIELYNPSAVDVDLSGASLSDAPGTNKFHLADGTILPPRGFIAFDQFQLGFTLGSGGESVYLVNSNGTRVIDAIRFGAQAPDVTFGRWPDGSPVFRSLQSSSPGARNSPARRSSVVINEIMYRPISGNSNDEYVELYNRSVTPVNLAGWALTGGVQFTFPSHAVLPAGGYVVIANNWTNLLAHYPQLSAGQTFGNFDGNLGNGGDRIALTSPEWIVATNLDGLITTNLHHVRVNEVTYGVGGRWGQWSAGGGSSLELIDSHSDNSLADNWADSDETAKAPWTEIEAQGRLAHGDGQPNALHVLLLGAGECLIDDLAVVGPSGVNLLANPGFESGLAPWVLQGNHEPSRLQDDGGWNNSRCLRLRTDGDGDAGANKIRALLTANLTVNSKATLRARARWLRGHPEFLLRTAGSYLDTVGRMTIPSNLGTPGTANSRAGANAGPAIYDVRHEPILPAANQPIQISARVNDPDDVATVTVCYRVDPDTNNVMTVPMSDDGTGGDAVPGDGRFTATLPGRATGSLIAFHLQARDNAAAPASRTFPADAPSRECLVRFGETESPGAFGAYRIWMTQANVNRWTARLKLSNEALDATFVQGRHRVIYNAGALYAGSPFHSPRYTSPTGVACDYKLIFPSDDPFLGSDEATIVWPGLTGGDPVDQTAQREVTSYGLAAALGLPFNYQRFVHFFLNGTRRSFIMQDTQKPDRDFLDQWHPEDPDGSLFKVQIWYELDATAASVTTMIPATLGLFVTDGQKKTSRYRWSWTPRGGGAMATDFRELFALVDAVNSPAETYTANVEAVIDIEQWMRTMAVEHLVGNWDSYGYGNGQNMYLYKPARGRWQMMIWDVDVSLGNASDPANADLFKLTNPYFPNLTGDPAIVGRMYQHPAFVRAYWRAVQEAVDGPLLGTTVNPLLDARTAAFAANAVAAAPADPIKLFLSTRRSYCLGRLATVAANFTVNSPPSPDTSNNLILVSGTAPITVKDIVINGVPFPVTWTSVTSWTARVVLQSGINELVVQALDRLGHELSGFRQTNTVSYTNLDVDPAGTVVINEVQYHPATAGAAFVELFNNSARASFDLSGWRLNGASYVFPPGSILTNGQYLVLAENRAVFGTAYGTSRPVFAEFNGKLQTNGETLTLFRSGPQPDQEQVVDRVRYEPGTPWPAGAAGRGASLQRIDPAREAGRVSNWGAADPAVSLVLATPGASNSITRSLPRYDPLWINEVQPDNMTGLIDGLGHRGPWIELHNTGTNVISLETYALTDRYTDLVRWTFPTGARLAPGEFTVVWADGAPTETTAAEWHTEFRLDPVTGSVALTRRIEGSSQIVDYVNYGAVPADQALGSIPDGQPFTRRVLPDATPGRSNRSNLPITTVFINEWMASNVSPGGLPEPVSGNYEDWFELYNAGPDVVDLTGCGLTDDLSAPFKFVVPGGYRIPANGYLLVWADDETSRNQTNQPHLHVNFQLSRDGEALGLFAPDGRPIDAVQFGPQTNNISQGRLGDGGLSLVFLPRPSPGAANAENGTDTLVITGIERGPEGDVLLSWVTILGRMYRVEYQDELGASEWMALGADHFGTGGTLHAIDPAATVAQRFYRIRQLP